MNDTVKNTQDTQVPGEGENLPILVEQVAPTDTSKVVQEVREETIIPFIKNKETGTGNGIPQTVENKVDENLELAQYFCDNAKKLAEDSVNLINKVDAFHNDWQPLFKTYNVLNKSEFPKEQYPEMYTQFRKDLNIFYKNNDKFRQSQEQVKNVGKLQEFFTRFNNIKLSGDTQKDFETLREYDKQWWSMKNLPHEKYAEYKKQFEDIFNKHLNSMPISQSEKEIFMLENFINSVSNKKNAKDLLVGRRGYFSAKFLEAKTEYDGYTAFSGTLPSVLQRKKAEAKTMMRSYQIQMDMVNKALDNVSPGWRNEKKPNPPK